jgi:hypothetical protein
MNDRKLLVLIGTQVATFLAVAALVALTIVNQSQMIDAVEKVAREIRDTREARYEYKVVSYATDAPSRTGDDAMKYASVTPDESALTSLGSAGWEVVASYLEVETAFPNFGRSDYVTGLQPNVRPQRLVIILRRRVA